MYTLRKNERKLGYLYNNRQIRLQAKALIKIKRVTEEKQFNLPKIDYQF